MRKRITRALPALALAATLGWGLATATLPARAADVPAAAPAASATATAPTTSGHVKFQIRPADDAWRAALPHDAEKATQAYLDRLPADVVARSNDYFEGGYWLILWNWLMGLAVAAVLLAGRRSARLRDWSHRRAGAGYLGDAVYVGAWWVIGGVLSLPLDIYQGFVREHQYGMATQTFGPWFVEHAQGLGIGALIAMIVVPLLYRGIRRTGERWWLFGTAFSIGFMVLGLMVAPVWIEPIFNTYKPVQDPTVRDAVIAMAHADGVPADNVYEFDASRQTTRVSANVTGVFGSAAVRLNDNLLHRSSLPEIRAVMGHELGHYVMNHIWKAIAEFTIVLLVAFSVTNWAMRRVLAARGDAWGLRGRGDIASLPVLAAVFSTFMFLATPVMNTLVRTQEIEADRFGLNLSREPLGEAEADLKLTEYRKPDPGPVEEFLFFDHPSTRFRIHDAMRWREAMRQDGPQAFWPAAAPATASAGPGAPAATPPTTGGRATIAP